MRKKIAILGSTGSVGISALNVARHLKNEIEVVALAAKSSIALLEKQAREFQPKLIAVYEKEAALALQKKIPHIPVVSGLDGLREAAVLSSVDFVLLAMVGSVGLLPAIAAIQAGKQIGLANKEILVSAGELVTSLAREHGVELIPVDSEHSALFQVLRGERKEDVRRLILTASGGPFRERVSMEGVSFQDAMIHPNFRVGPKVGVNSSTLMNKGFEMIQAKWLFDVRPEQIDVVIHPQQRIQSCVEFVDGTVMAQMGEPDMRLPIQYAMTYPKRLPSPIPPYDFVKNGTLTFFPPDLEKFRCLRLAIDAMKEGKSYPCFLNGVNEVLVERFLQGEISWLEIGTKLEKLISSHKSENLLTLEAILEVDNLARKKASTV